MWQIFFEKGIEENENVHIGISIKKVSTILGTDPANVRLYPEW